ncbi:hypothetical protein [Streptomyces netropsis]|uniref:Uncharacterized protein n=1 Tax=Streptomyces netropsis TaxID=55404 RepID=A0A7W7PEF4_STRNE|nr:hypothetical protein [Streptomyces netropsis]MBB4886999.1 hypothetical protein [Streptomyces netropsis]GGR24795.1 hypothetical protein GCM10010219_31980 [Streptomyces netropsis]
MRDLMARWFGWVRALSGAGEPPGPAPAAPQPEPSSPYHLWVTPHGIDVRPRRSYEGQVAPPGKTYEPEPGDLVHDTVRDCAGIVMGHEGPRFQLRPLGGGVEWEVAPVDIRPLSQVERLSARVAEANNRSTWGAVHRV